jgi:signal transduction histidine kinase
LGLHTALSNHVEEWSEKTGIRADFHSNGLIQTRLPPPIETTVYRIVQEALTNVVKHARAQNVSIIVEHRGNRVMAIIEDDGLGFDVEAMLDKPMSQRRLGLIGMKERTSLVNGKLDIESTPGVGTTVILQIPLTTPRLEDALEKTTHSIGR